MYDEVVIDFVGTASAKHGINTDLPEPPGFQKAFDRANIAQELYRCIREEDDGDEEEKDADIEKVFDIFHTWGLRKCITSKSSKLVEWRSVELLKARPRIELASKRIRVSPPAYPTTKSRKLVLSSQPKNKFSKRLRKEMMSQTRKMQATRINWGKRFGDCNAD